MFIDLLKILQEKREKDKNKKMIYNIIKYKDDILKAYLEGFTLKSIYESLTHECLFKGSYSYFRMTFFKLCPEARLKKLLKISSNNTDEQKNINKSKQPRL